MSEATAKHFASLTIAEMREEIEGFREQAERYRKALELLEERVHALIVTKGWPDGGPEIHEPMRLAREALSDAKATAQPAWKMCTHAGVISKAECPYCAADEREPVSEAGEALPHHTASRSDRLL